MGVKVINNLNKFVGKNYLALDRAMERMAVDIERLAKQKVPVELGPLQSSGRKVKLGLLKHRVEFNKEYAAFQEFGGDKTRKVRKYTTPGTGAHFLRDAGVKVSERVIQYIRGAVSELRL